MKSPRCLNNVRRCCSRCAKGVSGRYSWPRDDDKPHRQRDIAPALRQADRKRQRALLASLREVSKTGITRQDQEISCNGRLLLCNMVPVKSRAGDRRHHHLPRQNRNQPADAAHRRHGELRRCPARPHARVYEQTARDPGLLHIKRYDKLEEYILQTAHNYQTDIGTIQSR